MQGYNHPKEYIASQGPLENTVADFWRMVYEHDVPTIVMLTNLVEKMKAKCSQYWPMCDSETYSNMEVTVVNTTTLADFVIRDIKIKNVSKLMNINFLVDRHCYSKYQVNSFNLLLDRQLYFNRTL